MDRLYAFPDMHHKRAKDALAADAAVREIADLVARKRFGVPALALPTERREVLIAYLEELWTELALMALAEDTQKGRAS
jgi:hypothetical protein